MNNLAVDPCYTLDTQTIVEEWRNGQPEVYEDHRGYDYRPPWARMTEEDAERYGIERPQNHDVSFHYNAKVEQHHFGKTHPMKPWRLTLTKQLVFGYGLQWAMDCYQARPATKDELAIFHDRGYLDFLQRVRESDENSADYIRYQFGEDCPVFDGMWDYVSLYAGATISATDKLINEQSDIAINWSGGLHHAKKMNASGFCYINDIVISIQHLLRFYPRVLYIDIDVHHGDGVEQAFWSTDRVLTLSYHKYNPEEFFPGTGGAQETGPPDTYTNPGAHYSLNVPLKDGIDDEQYTSLFRNITGACIQDFDPSAIVLQCGADSLGGDRLGKFNLNITAHADCVDYVKSQCHDRKLLIIGGGGYTPRNVARAWCHETALCTENKLPANLPDNIPFRQAFEGEAKGDGVLLPNLSHLNLRHPNEHTPIYLQGLENNILTQLRYIQGAPSVCMQQIPRDHVKIREEAEARCKEEGEDYDREEAEERRVKLEKNLGGRREYRGI